MSSTVIGVCLALAGGVIQSIGFVLQKKGHNKLNSYLGTKNELKLDTVEEAKKISITTIPIWWAGIIIYQVGNLLRAIALSFAAQSIISPLMAFTIAINAIFTHFFLDEKIKKNDAISILFIIIGLVLVIIFGPTSADNSDITISSLGGMFYEMDYIILASSLTCVAVIIFAISLYFQHKNYKSNNNHAIASGKQFLLFAWTFIAGYFRANNTVFVKSLTTIIKSSFSSTTNLQQNSYAYLTYFIAFVWLFCLVAGEYFRQRALSYFGATFVVPLDFSFSVIFSVFLGGVFFNEFEEMDSVLNIVLFSAGLVITIIAALLLGYGTGRSLDEIYKNFIKVAFVDPNKIYYKEPKVAVFGGFVAYYYSSRFLKQIPFFVNGVIKSLELKEIEENEDGKTQHAVRPSFSWRNMPTEQRLTSKVHLESKLMGVSPILFLLVTTMFIFAKLEISFYRFGAMWIMIAQFGLLFFVFRAYQSKQLCEVRSKLCTMEGFTENVAFSVGCELKKDCPITSVCRFAGVRGSTQEMLFVFYILGCAGICTIMVAMKAAERGKDLFTNSGKWDTARRTDITLLCLFPLTFSLTFLYIISVVEHGTVGRNIHTLSGTVSNLAQPIAFLIYQNFSIFSICCVVISIFMIIGYKINGSMAPKCSDDCAIVHHWSLRNLTVETVLIVWSSAVAAMIAWCMDGDTIIWG